jgi:hypothetical protein
MNHAAQNNIHEAVFADIHRYLPVFTGTAVDSRALKKEPWDDDFVQNATGAVALPA